MTPAGRDYRGALAPLSIGDAALANQGCDRIVDAAQCQLATPYALR